MNYPFIYDTHNLLNVIEKHINEHAQEFLESGDVNDCPEFLHELMIAYTDFHKKYWSFIEAVRNDRSILL